MSQTSNSTYSELREKNPNSRPEKLNEILTQSLKSTQKSGVIPQCEDISLVLEGSGFNTKYFPLLFFSVLLCLI